MTDFGNQEQNSAHFNRLNINELVREFENVSLLQIFYFLEHVCHVVPEFVELAHWNLQVDSRCD